MFAVPGWAVSASSLQIQTAEPVKKSSSVAVSAGIGHDPPQTAGKKRKRKSQNQNVNVSNVADLWDTVIAGNVNVKKLKNGKSRHDRRIDVVSEVDRMDDHPERTSSREKLAKKKKEKHQAERVSRGNNSDDQVVQKATSSTADTSRNKDLIDTQSPPSKPTPGLTPLQASMRQKLISARFRHLNQTLYTAPSSHSLELFQQNPEMFNEYHEGFRRQVEVWPQNPVTSYIEEIRIRSKQKGSSRASDLPPLPRSQSTCTIADLGCGEAALAQYLDKDRAELNVKIHSYDLQCANKFVTKADIANLPLQDESVDVAVFCLALMGTNWIDFIEEACRVLRWKGELWVAEIKSRFGRVERKGGAAMHSVGNKKKFDKKVQKKLDVEVNDEIAGVEVDGAEDLGQETDVSAFVEVLRRRGFLLQSERLDLSNTMFVKLNFVKGCTPTKGKCVPVPKGMAEMKTWRKNPKAKFLDDWEVAVSSEAGVLKPCVYRLR